MDYCGFEERGGSVGVVLEELGGAAGSGSRPCEVEAAVERGGLVVPGPLDGFDGEFGDVEFGVTLFVDDVLGGGEAHLLQLVAGGFEGVDLGGGELVGGGFVPVGSAVFESVEGEADGLDFLLPVVARGEGDALHDSPELVILRRCRRGRRLRRCRWSGCRLRRRSCRSLREWCSCGLRWE